MSRAMSRRLVHLLILIGFLLLVDFLSPSVPVVSVVDTVEKTPIAQTLPIESFIVSRVVDGDTIEVKDGTGTISKVRLIGIDTPETVDPRKTVQCFGKEASNRTKVLLEGKTVQLAADPTQDDRDKYARLLRYVSLLDDTDVNLSLIRDGYAHEYTYHVPYQRQAVYKAAQREAESAGRGLWAAGACL